MEHYDVLHCWYFVVTIKFQGYSAEHELYDPRVRVIFDSKAKIDYEPRYRDVYIECVR